MKDLKRNGEKTHNENNALPILISIPPICKFLRTENPSLCKARCALVIDACFRKAGHLVSKHLLRQDFCAASISTFQFQKKILRTTLRTELMNCNSQSADGSWNDSN